MAAIKNYFGKDIATLSTISNVVTLPSGTSQVPNGTTGNEYFKLDGKGGHTVYGGGGDDTFFGVTSTDKLIEPTGYTGLATVYASSNYTLAAFATNLYAVWAPGGVSGNARDNYIQSYVKNITINGGAGNDVMTGLAGDNYRFDAGSGFDVITNFAPGARLSVGDNPETVQLSGYAKFKTFAQVKAAMTQVGSDVVLKLDANDAIKFLNTKIGDFSADNFLLRNAPATSALKMTFSDEFSSSPSASGGGLQTLWRTDYGWGGNSNALMARTLFTTGEKEIFVDPTMVSLATGKAVNINPFSVNAGVLTIHAAPTPTAALNDLYGMKFTSGMLSTRDSFTQTYGYFEAKMKLPAGGGAWPAFWLYSVNGGAEIDIMESHSADTWTATTHSYATGSEVMGASTIYTPDLSTASHTFGLLWNASTITWYLDGVAVRSIATPADMNGPMYLMLGMALDSTTSSSFTGADLQVDYVHAYSLDNLPASVVTGSGGNDTLNDLNHATTLTGGVGDDKYFVSNTATKVIEAAGQGIDTVTASVNYTLPTNVEKLVLVGPGHTATSNAAGGILVASDAGSKLVGVSGTDILLGGIGNDTLVAGSGKTTLTGGGGADTFVFGPHIGGDLITDFDVRNDHLDLSQLAGHGFTLLTSGANAVLQIADAGAIVFQNVAASSLVDSGALHTAHIDHNAYSFFGTL